MFQKNTLQRRNLKKLTLDEDSTGVGITPGSVLPVSHVIAVDQNYSISPRIDEGSPKSYNSDLGPVIKSEQNIKENLAGPSFQKIDDKATGRRKRFGFFNTSNQQKLTTSINGDNRLDRDASSPSNIIFGSQDNVPKTGKVVLEHRHQVNIKHDMSSESIVTKETGVRIELRDLVSLGKLGSGNSGTVVKCLHVPSSKIVAKKIIPIENNNDTVKNQLQRELNIMQNVSNHPNIIGFYNAIYNNFNNEIIILMEYMDCGSLDRIAKLCKTVQESGNKEISSLYPKIKFNELIISRISESVLQGLQYLYDKHRIIHRDIKPSNVVINSRGDIKLCDFGVSKQIGNSVADTFVGTSTYMSPERIQGNVYTIKGDVWSLGLMIIELVSGNPPLGNYNDSPAGILDLLQRIVNEPSPSLRKDCAYGIRDGLEERGTKMCHNEHSQLLIDFVDRCCVKQEVNRASIEELLDHPLIAIYNAPELAARFKKWCKLIKGTIKRDKQVAKETKERQKLEQIQMAKYGTVNPTRKSNVSR